jgi:hypothetical protein
VDARTRLPAAGRRGWSPFDRAPQPLGFPSEASTRHLAPAAPRSSSAQAGGAQPVCGDCLWPRRIIRCMDWQADCVVLSHGGAGAAARRSGAVRGLCPSSCAEARSRPACVLGERPQAAASVIRICSFFCSTKSAMFR